jgi:hypothetical protein
VDCTKTHFCRIAFVRDWRFHCASALKGTHPHTWTRLVVSSYYQSLISIGGRTVILRVELIARGTIVATFVDFIAVNSAITIGIITNLLVAAIAIVINTNFVVAAWVDFIAVDYAVTIIIITNFSI